MSDVQDPIAAAIAQAQAAAASLAALQSTAVAVSPPTPTSQATAVAPLRPGAPLSMGDMLGGGLSVDGWIGVNEHGLTAGATKALVANDEVFVEIDMSAVALNYAIKFGKTPPTYYKTYDRVMEARGGSWADAVERATKADPGAREYPSADVPMTMLQDLIGPKKAVLLTAGTSVGYSIATTGWGNFKKFYAECVKAGLTSSTVKVKIEAEPKSNANGNNWGVIKWTLAA